MAGKPNTTTSNGANALMDALKADIAAALAGGLTGEPPMTPGEGVEFYDGTKIRVPSGMGYDGARRVIDRAQKEAETETRWDRSFKYRFNDGAYALMQVLKSRYGGAFGESIRTFFGPQPPELRTIDIAYGVTAQVPEGRMSAPGLENTSIYSGETRDREYGNIFSMVVVGPRKYKGEVQAIFDDVEAYLRDHSIYRGKAVVGANKLDFLNLGFFDPKQIVFSDKATELLRNTLWGVLDHADALEAEGIPLKRAVLLYGPYGTGKTSAGLVTAVAAVRNGWTYLSARSGRDKIEDVLRTARLYQPAVVLVEDIDNETSSGDAEEVTRLLEAFDGVTAKGSKVMLVMTTNHLERVHRGMLRPGRFDAVVEIAALDRNGIERLIKAVVDGDKLAAKVEYDAVAEAMDGFYPAFVREAIDRARIVAITHQGSRNYVLDTQALVGAARTVRAQLDVFEAAAEGERKPPLDALLREIVGVEARGGVSKLVVDAGDHGEHWAVIDPELENAND
jgi:hypothetical protein